MMEPTTTVVTSSRWLFLILNAKRCSQATRRIVVITRSISFIPMKKESRRQRPKLESSVAEAHRHRVAEYLTRLRATGSRAGMISALKNLERLGRVGIEVNHVARFFGSLGTRVHRKTDVRLSQCRRVVGAITHHCGQLAPGPFFSDVGDGCGCRLDCEIVDAGPLSYRCGSQRIIAGES